MDKSEIRMNQTDGKDRQLKGLQNKGVVHIECADCGKDLLVLQLTSVGDVPSDILTRIVVKCGSCSGYSWVRQVPGQFYPGAPSDDMAFEILEGDYEAPDADVVFRAWCKG